MLENVDVISYYTLQGIAKIISEYPAILSRSDTLNTAVIASLIFLLSGQDFTENKDTKEMKGAKMNAAKSDYRKIKLQEKDLEKASKELYLEKLSLEQEIGMLMAKEQSTEELIEKEIKPQVSTLKEKLSAYKDAIECQKEIDVLKKLSEQKTADMIENDTDEESELKFKVKEHLDYSFINELNNAIKSFLKNCNYDNLLSVVFDKADMDIVINGKKKSSNGKGYNPYFNSVVAIVLSRYMKSKAK